ncbi:MULTISPECIES: GyrI-like domain-containing protein [Nocardia]|uniref:GyrI-like domain-containing protein n=1 Tax=Nocardia TaxID=1817 RepID=UPI000D68E4C4|nr:MULTISPECIES: GyrI-like domain-containing protein [Nocardia]
MKLDLAKSDKQYYTAPTDPVLRAFDTYGYATVTGEGAPLGSEYTDAVSALYRSVYGAKKLAKATNRDFVVPKLEGQWWVDSDDPPLSVPREEWRWRMMIRLPDFVTAEMIIGAEYERFHEGDAIQVMHIGPYATEPETLARMETFMTENSLTMNGRHHEIYLSDPRRSATRTRTILRHPVRARSRQPILPEDDAIPHISSENVR